MPGSHKNISGLCAAATPAATRRLITVAFAARPQRVHVAGSTRGEVTFPASLRNQTRQIPAKLLFPESHSEAIHVATPVSDLELRANILKLADDIEKHADLLKQRFELATRGVVPDRQPGTSLAKSPQFDAMLHFLLEEPRKSLDEVNGLFRKQLDEAALHLRERGVRVPDLKFEKSWISAPDLRPVVRELRRAVREIGAGSGYVAFLDLLGFSRRMASGPSEEFFVAYLMALSRALDRAESIRYVVSSDNIVLFTTDDSENGLVEIVRAVARTMNELILLQIPVRGAVAYGRFRETRTPRGSIIAGSPIIDAYAYEQRQDWIGAILTPSVFAKHPHVTRTLNLLEFPKDAERFQTGPALIRRWSVSYKEGNGAPEKYEAIAIVPTSSYLGLPDAYRASVEAILTAIEDMRRAAPDPAAQKKYENSAAWLRSLK